MASFAQPTKMALAMQMIRDNVEHRNETELAASLSGLERASLSFGNEIRGRRLVTTEHTKIADEVAR